MQPRRAHALRAAGSMTLSKQCLACRRAQSRHHYPSARADRHRIRMASATSRNLRRPTPRTPRTYTASIAGGSEPQSQASVPRAPRLPMPDQVPAGGIAPKRSGLLRCSCRLCQDSIHDRRKAQRAHSVPLGAPSRPLVRNLENRGIRTESAALCLRRGLDLGLTHIDTAEMSFGVRGEHRRRAISGLATSLFGSKVLPSNASKRGTLRGVREFAGALRTIAGLLPASLARCVSIGELCAFTPCARRPNPVLGSE